MSSPQPHASYERIDTDVLVVGAGPAGSAAATWAARSGLDVVLIDAARFPRDKTCGDGLTPRAIAELNRLGMAGWLRGRTRNWGVVANAFGQSWHLPWPASSFPSYGSATPRSELDEALLAVALAAGVRVRQETRTLAVERSTSGAVKSVICSSGTGSVAVRCRRLIVADGARSKTGKMLGRIWHRETIYGVAARSYVPSARADEPWITSHMDMKDPSGSALPGYGWIFPLGNGAVNLGVGTLATGDRPANINLSKLLHQYYLARRDEWGMTGEPDSVRSALLPMGGSVSGIAGPNWVLIGDAAGCVNPLNGEGVDYGLETGRMAADLLASGAGLARPGQDLSRAWPRLLGDRYGHTYSASRRVGHLFLNPRLLSTVGPYGMRSRALMNMIMRVAGNFITDEDTDLIARLWRVAGRWSWDKDERPPFSN
ncbi:MAG: geranylgeranyl reductase family protein [Candidatus Nanopelagicales bacterium]|nr:geranylgeranyl reductase family protein [Candidatus Nanopelagicales bacterium]